MDAMTPKGHLCSGPCREVWDGVPLAPPRLNRTLKKKQKNSQSGSLLHRRERNSERDIVKHFGQLFFLQDWTDEGLLAEFWLPSWGVSVDLQLSFIYSQFHVKSPTFIDDHTVKL